MSQWIPTHITVGGRIPRELVPGLCRAICNESGGLDWGDDAFKPRRAADLLAARQLIGNAAVLRLFDETACWGKFELLEAFLIEHRIPFDRQHDAKFDISAGRLVYRPDSGTHEFLTDSQERIVIQAGPLCGHIEMLEQAQRDLAAGRAGDAAGLLASCVKAPGDPAARVAGLARLRNRSGRRSLTRNSVGCSTSPGCPMAHVGLLSTPF